MKHYLAIHECPADGPVPVLFEAETDNEAESRAWEDSLVNPYYVLGGYDLYRLEYNPYGHTHILVPVVPDLEEVCE